MNSTQVGANEAKSELQDMMSSEVAQHQSSLVGSVTNNRGQTLSLLTSQHWTGNYHTAPPASVGAGEKIIFSHKGAKGAFVFGQQQGSTNGAAYLLAWSFINGSRKVYVKCGPVSELVYNGWENAVLAKLDSSGEDSSARHDGTSSNAQARIRDEGGPYPLSSVVGSFN